MYYFYALKQYQRRALQNYEDTRTARAEAEQFSDSKPAQTRLQVALERMQENDDFAEADFKRDMDEAICQMRRNNHIRQIEPPDNNAVNVIAMLKLVYHISPEVLAAAISTLHNSPLAMMALQSVYMHSWADDPLHELPTVLKSMKLPMAEDAAERIIAKIQRYAKKLEKCDAAREAPVFDTENEFLAAVCKLSPDEIDDFKRVIMNEAKY